MKTTCHCDILELWSQKLHFLHYGNWNVWIYLKNLLMEKQPHYCNLFLYNPHLKTIGTPFVKILCGKCGWKILDVSI